MKKNEFDIQNDKLNDKIDELFYQIEKTVNNIEVVNNKDIVDEGINRIISSIERKKMAYEELIGQSEGLLDFLIAPPKIDFFNNMCYIYIYLIIC